MRSSHSREVLLSVDIFVGCVPSEAIDARMKMSGLNSNWTELSIAKVSTPFLDDLHSLLLRKNVKAFDTGREPRLTSLVTRLNAVSIDYVSEYVQLILINRFQLTEIVSSTR